MRRALRTQLATTGTKQAVGPAARPAHAKERGSPKKAPTVIPAAEPGRQSPHRKTRQPGSLEALKIAEVGRRIDLSLGRNQAARLPFHHPASRTDRVIRPMAWQNHREAPNQERLASSRPTKTNSKVRGGRLTPTNSSSSEAPRRCPSSASQAPQQSPKSGRPTTVWRRSTCPSPCRINQSQCRSMRRQLWLK